jgi:hypothetical protein
MYALYNNILGSFEYCTFIDDEEEDSIFTIKQKKRVTFNTQKYYYIIPALDDETRSNLWWSEEDHRLAMKKLDKEVSSFMEMYNENRLNLRLKPISKRHAYKLYYTFVKVYFVKVYIYGRIFEDIALRPNKRNSRKWNRRRNVGR